MATPPDEIKRLEAEIRRLRAEMERSREELEEERLSPEVAGRIPPAPTARRGESLASYMQRRREYYEQLPETIRRLEEEEGTEEERRRRLGGILAARGQPPERQPNESIGAFIARRRRYYAEQKQALKEEAERERLAAMAIPEEQLPAIPSKPEPGESREAFLARQRAAVEERERAVASIMEERREAARSTAQPTLTQEEALALSERRTERRTARAVRLARRILKQRAAAEKIEVPFVPEEGESQAAFDVRVAEAQLRKSMAEKEWNDAIHALEEILRYPQVELATRQTAAGPIPPSPRLRAVAAANKAFAMAVLEVFYDPARYGLTPEGLTQEEVGEQRMSAAVPAIPIVSITKAIDDYTVSKRNADALVREATDMLGHQYSQIDQWIAFTFLSGIGKLPQDFTADMIMQVPGNEFEQQAKDFLIRHGGFIGLADHTAEINRPIMEAGPPVVLGPLQPTDPQAIITEAAGYMKEKYDDALRSMNNDVSQLVEGYSSGVLNAEQRGIVENFAAANGITLPPVAEVPATPEARFSKDSNAQGLINEIARLRSMNTPESMMALRALVARLAAESVSDNPDVAARALYVMQAAKLA